MPSTAAYYLGLSDWTIFNCNGGMILIQSISGKCSWCCSAPHLKKSDEGKPAITPHFGCNNMKNAMPSMCSKPFIALGMVICSLSGLSCPNWLTAHLMRETTCIWLHYSQTKQRFLFKICEDLSWFYSYALQVRLEIL